MFEIQEELKKLPEKPGVYIMKDETDQVIYIGKAINLKNRVRQYFNNSKNHTLKVITMVSFIKEFEYIITDTELEALILENNLIKEHKPKYNILLKDDKSYPYIKVTVNESFPKIFMTRNHLKDKAKYFGPYTSMFAIKETIELIHKIWPIRRCFRKFPRDLGKGRPCLDYHIGKCKAPCNNSINQDDYMRMINDALLFLNGKTEVILKRLETEMFVYSDNMEFEKAAEIRDTITAVKKLEEKQKIDADNHDDQDIIAFARANDEALVQVFFIRAGKMIGREHFMLNGVDKMSKEEVMTAFIKQFYSETTFIPKEIILETDIVDKEIIVKWLSTIKGKNVIISVPQIGDKIKLVKLAAKNAIITLEQFGDKINKEREKSEGAIEEIRKALGIEIKISRIEAYDISNIQGVESVGSMVVFENGKPKRSDYRKFKIKGVLGPNDYASMEEVLSRRFLRYKNEDEKFSTLPDIIFMDGGKGQISSANKILKNLQLNILVCGMLKDDRHRTKAIIFNNEEIYLKENTGGFKLITRIQDEVHRFAIEYHRKLRQKNQLHSVLEDIEGIGEKRRKKLLLHFGSIENIKKANCEQLEAVEGMNKKCSKAIFDFFRK